MSVATQSDLRTVPFIAFDQGELHTSGRSMEVVHHSALKTLQGDLERYTNQYNVSAMHLTLWLIMQHAASLHEHYGRRIAHAGS